MWFGPPISMPVLTKIQHERFAQAVITPQARPDQCYVQVFGHCKGAAQSASRLLKNAKVSARISELRAEVAHNLLGGSIRDAQYRLDQLQKRHESLMQIVRERGLEYQGLADLRAILNQETGLAEPEAFAIWQQRYPMLSLGLPNESLPIHVMLRGNAAGGTTGYMVRDYKGLGALMSVYKVDTGLLSELRAIERQAAEELGQWQAPAALSVQVHVLIAKLTAGRERAAKLNESVAIANA